MTNIANRALVSLPREEGLLLINRNNLHAVLLPSEATANLEEAVAAKTPYPPREFGDAIAETGFATPVDIPWYEHIILRDRPTGGFGRVTWEITERCNFRCVHCYLDEKKRRGLPLDQRLRILDKLERAGCLWLQITGGEALADPLFEQTYRAAWERGMVISVLTNGVCLARWVSLFRQLPPRRIVVSLYGASGESYSAMTGSNPATFSAVMDALGRAQDEGLRLRVSVIGAKPNAHEIGRMETLLRDRGIDHHVYTSLSPTVNGNALPLDQEVQFPRSSGSQVREVRCAGGVTALHVQVSGRAGPCKLLPYVSGDLLTEDISALRHLACHSGARPTRPECGACPSRNRCATCGPVFALYKKAQGHTNRVCRYRAA